MPRSKTAVTFVEYVTDRQAGDARSRSSRRKRPQADARSWLFTYTGKGAFASQDRQAVPVAARDRLGRRSPRGPHPRIQVRPRRVRDPVGCRSRTWTSVSRRLKPAASRRPAAARRFTIPGTTGCSGSGCPPTATASVSQSSGYFSGNVSANRTTEAVEDPAVRIQERQHQPLHGLRRGDGPNTKEGDWSLDSLVVKSLGEHWSAGFTSALTSSTYSNQRRVANFNPAIEYDFFPYSESSQRSLTIQYAAGPSHYEYAEITIYGKLAETMPQTQHHGVARAAAALGQRRSLGGVFTDPERAGLQPAHAERQLQRPDLSRD